MLIVFQWLEKRLEESSLEVGTGKEGIIQYLIQAGGVRLNVYSVKPLEKSGGREVREMLLMSLKNVMKNSEFVKWISLIHHSR